MKQVLLVALTLGICIGSLSADEMVKEVQERLGKAGFYQGKTNGTYNSETSAAVTRYQIRQGLPITGKLDPETLKALDVPPPKSMATAAPSPVSGTWRRLRNGDMQFLKRLNAGEIPPPKAPVSPLPRKLVVASSLASPNTNVTLDPHAPPPPLPEDVPQPTPNAPRQDTTPDAGDVYNTQRLRDYVAAFVLAGLDPQVGAELEFFADRVDYYGKANVSREKVRRDLLRYDERWPHRQFWLDGDIEVLRKPNGILQVTFPLRYQLRNGPKSTSGQVKKTLILRKAGAGDLEIVGVEERKK